MSSGKPGLFMRFDDLGCAAVFAAGSLCVTCVLLAVAIKAIRWGLS